MFVIVPSSFLTHFLLLFFGSAALFLRLWCLFASGQSYTEAGVVLYSFAFVLFIVLSDD